jgi:hypothetical protein
MSSLSRQSRDNIPIEPNETNGKPTTASSSSSSILKPIKKRILPTRNRSTSPKTPSSDPSISTKSSPFFLDSPPQMRSSSTTPSDLNHISTSSTTSVTTSTIPTPETVGLNFNFDAIYTQLRELAEINSNYFSKQKTDVCRRFARLLIQLLHSLELSIPLIRYLTENFHHFDYSPEVNIISFFIFILLVYD